MPFSDLTLPTKYKDFEDRWKWIIAFMVIEDVFVHEVLLLMTKVASTSVPTMGVYVDKGRLYLHYNLEWISTLTDPELRYVVTHEIYHVVFHHCTIRLPRNKEDHKLYNIAGDLAINSLIPETPTRHMPKKKDGSGKHIGVLPKDYEFHEKLSMEQYVMLLKEKGVDGSNYDGFDSHDGWSDEDKEVVKQIIRNKIEQLSKKESVWGKIPGDIQAMIMAAQRSSIAWHRYLRQLLGDLLTSNKERTCKKVNKRYGLPFRGLKRTCTDRKLVALDTSGSIGDDDIARFLAECNTLAEQQPVDLIMFDQVIQTPIMPFETKKPKMNVKGRGGTAFTPVFELAEKRRYQSLIILTDGCAEEPPKPKFVKDVLWVLTAPGFQPPVPWGQRVWITPKGVPQPTADTAAATDDSN